MNAKISRWGNSIAVRIPRSVVDQSGLHEGDTVSVTVAADGSVVLRPAQRRGLAMLLNAITPENLHGETFGNAPVGAEVW